MLPKLSLLAVAGAALALAGCASTPAAAPAPAGPQTSAGTWSFGFDAGPGIANADLKGADGALLARLSCQAPKGPFVVTDWTNAAEGRASFAIGDAAAAAMAVVEPVEGRPAAKVAIPVADSVFRALTPAAPVALTINGRTHVLASGAASRVNDVLNSCRATGS